jgi:5-formyltetrahydrofolate cyclo-ligase
MAKKSIFSFLNFLKEEDEDSISLEKSMIRHKIRAQKKELTDEQKIEASNKIFEKIEQMPDFKQAKTLMMYWSTSREVPTHDFIDKWSKEKKILLPVVVGRMMVLKPFTGRENLTRSELGIWEPQAQETYLEEIDLAIIPGSAFDRKKRRLGRGRGYYDHFLKQKKIKKWGIAYDFQLVDTVPAAEHDIKMNKIITPTITVD